MALHEAFHSEHALETILRLRAENEALKARVRALERVRDLASMVPNPYSGASEEENQAFKRQYGIDLYELDEKLNEALAACEKFSRNKGS